MPEKIFYGGDFASIRVWLRFDYFQLQPKECEKTTNLAPLKIPQIALMNPCKKQIRHILSSR